MAIILITCKEDAALARAVASHLARYLGMTLRANNELTLAVSEMATNIWRHGVRGKIDLSATDEDIEVVAEDEGPGLADLGMALKDGYSQGGWLAPDRPRSGGLGCGLGTIQRMMDHVEFSRSQKGGLLVRAWKRRTVVAL